MVEEEHKSLRDYVMPLVTEIQLSIQRPAIQANNFEIKSGTIQMIQNYVQFGGLLNDDPNDHLVSFFWKFVTRSSTIELPTMLSGSDYFLSLFVIR